MTPDAWLPALAAFALATSITPGPNNLMLLASGANFGLRRTVPHMLGVALGFVAMAVVLGAGLVRAFEAVWWLEPALKALSVAYMLWLAWKVARAAPPEEGATAGRPLTFVQAALFQWVNPKAWAMATTAVTVYAPGEGIAAVLLVGAVFGAVNLPSVGVWAVAGTQLRRLLTDRRRLRAFNAGMAALLLASLYPILAG
ncbi:MAG: LysE family translocator [Paracoccaceae bacterium]